MNSDQLFKDRARVRDEDLTGRASTAGADALLAEIVSMERVPARRRLRLSPGRALLGLAAAAAAVAVIVPMTSSDRTISVEPRPGTSVSATAEPTARQILLAAAVAVEKAPSSGDYWRTATVNRWMLTDPTRSYVLEAGRSIETWLARKPGAPGWHVRQELGVKPATPQDEAAWRAAGSPTVWRYPEDMKTENLFAVPSRPLEAQAGERTVERLDWDTVGDLAGESLTWQQTRAIPDEPEALRHYLEERIGRLDLTGSGLDEEEARAHILLRGCVDIISTVPVSSGTRAAAYRLLASLPGIRAEGETTDPLGRRGQSLRYQEEIEPGLFSEVTLVVEPAGGRLLAEVRTNTTRLADGRQAELRVSRSFEEVGWTGERPEPPRN
ncbi:CU044_5270 family protein [Nonomuraea gerenzanensis]|uniref:Uncharacterized protein n=1 Tax=Nonomuraea gerenzanensis TaxID=93944 RepID=A0A1M4EIS7_9ACTN|nr:CU044_5270 family protein [Nonomuraea gerenzanensis]UBU10290.1 CU044_5270 family protein [Nonomuraea gerenzanensis]SBO98674.1 hypothetical protein BN4615_P8190 [Nonomuraea gerenzanensis]